MRIYVSLICFFVCTQAIIKSSKETCTAYTFQEKTKWKESTEMSQTTITLLFLVFTIISFILEKIPLGLTASICAIGLTLTGVVDATTTFSQYVNSNVILCVGMFVVGQALFETGMANKIGGLPEKTLSCSLSGRGITRNNTDFSLSFPRNPRNPCLKS